MLKIVRTVLMVHLTLFFSVAYLTSEEKGGPSIKPNIIVILADDLGYADLGCQGSIQVKTPHIDSLAANGVRCTTAYVTAPQCGPSRAGLLTGVYQNRFGYESNEQGYHPATPVHRKVIAEYLKSAGYVTGMMGKWGAGNKFELHPPQRGFDETLWNHDGNRYFPDTPHKDDIQMRKGNKKVPLTEYSTDAFGREAVHFIHRNSERPFFLYLPFITPHVPMEAKPEDLARFADEPNPLRRTFLAMMACLDDNVGRILEALREKHIEDNTLIFFLSDNGGCPENTSQNTPFSGTKSQMLEGGIRVPFIAQWKGRIPKGKIYPQPIISLDIVPTALASAGVNIDPAWQIDGVNLLPHFEGKTNSAPHEYLYWRFNFPGNKPEQHSWAIIQGHWKLVKNGWAKAPVALYNLEVDLLEKVNLINKEPERVKTMQAAWDIWNTKNIAPAKVK